MQEPDLISKKKYVIKIITLCIYNKLGFFESYTVRVNYTTIRARNPFKAFIKKI